VIPQLIAPTTRVRDSYLAGERADCLARGTPTGWLADAAEDFAAFVAVRCGVTIRWEVLSTVFWYCAGDDYLGSLVIRHELTPELLEVGGHIGYHVVAPWQRQGHATRMLAAGLDECRRMGMQRVLLTCDVDNEPSRKVILANGGIREDERRGEDRFWIDLDQSD
jgi:predicted acetyltransferase